MTLLEQAKAHRHKLHRHRLNCSEELIELAVAYANGEVTCKQVAVALQIPDLSNPSMALQRLAPALREGVKRGLVRPPAMRAR